MKIETQPLEDHHTQLTVEVDSLQMDEAKRRAARKIAHKVKIPGFRPGKAPYNFVLRYVGEEAILEEAMDLLVDEIYPKVIEESGIHPSGPGQLKEIKSIDPPVLEFSVPLKAVVELGDYRTIRIPYELKETTEAEVDEVIERLREQHALIEPADRPAQEGDIVTIQIHGTLANAAEDQDAELVKERTFNALIKPEGEPEPDEWPFPGFSRLLLGASVGEQRIVSHQFSDESPYPALRGKEANFEVSITEVRSRTLPELDDELAKTVGEFETLDALRTEIRADLKEHARHTYNETYDDQVLESLLETSSYKYTSKMLEDEIDNVLNNLENRLKQQGMDLQLYLKTRGMEMPALREEMRPVAEKRLKKTITLLELSEKEGIQVTQEELQDATMRTLDQYSRMLPESDFRKLTSGDDSSNLVGSIMMDLVIARTFDRLRDYARGQVVEASPESPMAGEETAPEAETLVEDDNTIETKS